MRRILLAGLLALPALGLCQGQASAWCLCPVPLCIEMPLPTIPVPIPQIKLFCPCCPPTAGCPLGHCGHPHHPAAGPLGAAPYSYPPAAYGPAVGFAPPAPWYAYWPPNAPFATTSPAPAYSNPVAPAGPGPYAPADGTAIPSNGRMAIPTGPTRPVSYQPALHHPQPRAYYQYAPETYYPVPSYWYGR